MSLWGRGGGARRAWERLRSAWPQCGEQGTAHFAEYPGHAAQLAADAGEAGTLVCLGGDGTVGEVLSGMMTLNPPRPRLLIVPGGTGNDAARQLGIATPEAAVAAFRHGVLRQHDVFRIECQNGNSRVRRYGFLYGSIGFSTASHIQGWMKRWLPASVTYLLGTALALLKSHPHTVTIESSSRRFSGPVWIVVAGNTERAGGNSFCVAPGSRSDDGFLNFTIVRAEAKLWTLAKLLLKAPSGAHVLDPIVDYFPGQWIRVESDSPCTVDSDGDRIGHTPAVISVCPNAIEVYAAR